MLSAKRMAKKGRCSEDEIRLHINVLELKAAFLALKAISKNQSHRVACLRMHNTTATAQINNKGSTGTGTCSGTCSGGLKTIVDSESRVINDNSECKINRQLISPFLKECDIDVDALTMNWEPFKGHAFPPFSAKHSNGGRSPEPSDRATSPHPDHQTPFEGSIRPSKDSPNVSQTAPCSVSHLRRQYQAMGISEDFTKILFSASRPSTRKTYRSALGR